MRSGVSACAYFVANVGSCGNRVDKSASGNSRIRGGDPAEAAIWRTLISPIRGQTSVTFETNPILWISRRFAALVLLERNPRDLELIDKGSGMR